MTLTASLPFGSTSPATARGMVAAELVGQGVSLDVDGAQVALLVVSELVTNALVHGLPPITVSADVRDHRSISVSVGDGHDEGPVDRGAPRSGQVGGWGLALVERMADSWGVAREVSTPGSGKRVWAEVSLSAEGPPLPAHRNE